MSKCLVAWLSIWEDYVHKRLIARLKHLRYLCNLEHFNPWLCYVAEFIVWNIKSPRLQRFIRKVRSLSKQNIFLMSICLCVSMPSRLVAQLSINVWQPDSKTIRQKAGFVKYMMTEKQKDWRIEGEKKKHWNLKNQQKRKTMDSRLGIGYLLAGRGGMHCELRWYLGQIKAQNLLNRRAIHGG